MDVSKCSGIIDLALKEDIGSGDITANLLAAEQRMTAKIIVRQNAVLCGCDFVDEVFVRLDCSVVVTWRFNDGDHVQKNDELCILEGSARALLTGERCALNFLQTLSATATHTKKFVDKIKGYNAILLDTRKTIPGLRLAQKYAVLCGGGQNHRIGLYDAFLIKENHIVSCGSITNAVRLARSAYPEKKIEVEVRNIEEFKEALCERVDVVMLDNFPISAIKQAVALNVGSEKTKIEISGGVNLDTVEQIAALGVDYISVGMLTKNIEAVDFSMMFF